MENLLTVNQICEWLSISRATLTNWRNKGLPAIKIGKTVRFDKEQVKEWLKSQDKLI